MAGIINPTRDCPCGSGEWAETCCDVCGREFCEDCGPYRDDDAPFDVCEDCLDYAEQEPVRAGHATPSRPEVWRPIGDRWDSALTSVEPDDGDEFPSMDEPGDPPFDDGDAGGPPGCLLPVLVVLFALAVTVVLVTSFCWLGLALDVGN